MTVLAWLLLCVTVIQLGQGNHSIRPEYGIPTVPDATVLPPLDDVTANTSNNTFSSIDRSQSRRVRRSSDLDDAEKAYNASVKAQEEAQAAFNLANSAFEAAKAENTAAESAKTAADKALSEAKAEETRADGEHKRAKTEDDNAAKAISDAETTRTAAETAYNKAKAALTKEMTEKHVPLQNDIRDIYEVDVNEKTAEMFKRLKVYEDAKKVASDYKIKLDDYNAKKKEMTGYGDTMTKYDEFKTHVDAKKDAKKKIADEKLDVNFNAAKTAHTKATTEQTEILNNEILNGLSTELDNMKIKDLVMQKSADAQKAQQAYDAGKNTAKEQELNNKLKAANSAHTFAKQLERFDQSKTVDAVRRVYNEMKRLAQEYLNNEILNGVNKEDFGKQTVKEVVTLKKGLVTAAKNKYNPTTDDTVLQKMKDDLTAAEKELEFLKELRGTKYANNIQDAKNEFLKEKAEADKNIKLCESNGFLNGNIKADFKTEKIQDAVVRKKKAFDDAKTKFDTATDPATKPALKTESDKAENEYKLMQEIELAFGKTMLVEEAKKKASDVREVIRKSKENDFLNGKNTKTFGNQVLGTVVTAQEQIIAGDKAKCTAKEKLKTDLAKAEKDLQFVNQLAAESENMLVEALKKTFKDTGKAQADSTIKDYNINDILRGENTEHDQKIVDKAIADQPDVIDAAKTAFEKEKTEPKKGQLKAYHEKAERDLKLLKQLKKYDFWTLKELKTILVDIKNKADAAVTGAKTKFDDADTKLKAQNTIINNADAKLNTLGTNEVEVNKALAQLEEESNTASLSLDDLKPKMATIASELDTPAGPRSLPTGEAGWDNVYTALKTESENEKTVHYDPAKEASKTANETLATKRNKAQEVENSIDLKEGQAERDAKTAKEAAETAVANAEKARKEPVDLVARLAAAKTADDNAKAEIDPLTKKAGAANEEADKKHKVYVDAMEKHVNARKALDDAIGNTASALKKRDEARQKDKDDKAAQALRDKEYQEQVRALSAGIGITGGIIVLVIAVGLSAFFIHRKRKAQKKAKVPKEPKREELAADNGLTIIRREGMPDKYVVKGCDFNFRGPLVRGNVHNYEGTKHLLDDQVGGDKIDGPLFFDKNMNDAYLIGEGVEIYPDDPKTVSEKGPAFNLDDLDDLSSLDIKHDKNDKYVPEETKPSQPRAAAPNPAAKKSSKSNRAKAASPAPNPPPSSSSDDQDKKKTPTPSK